MVTSPNKKYRSFLSQVLICTSRADVRNINVSLLLLAPLANLCQGDLQWGTSVLGFFTRITQLYRSNYLMLEIV